MFTVVFTYKYCSVVIFYCSPSSVGIFMQIKRMKNIETDHLLWATINHRYKPVRHLLLLCINRATKIIRYQIQDRNSIYYIWQCLISCMVYISFVYYENDTEKFEKLEKLLQISKNNPFLIIFLSIFPFLKINFN